ncbi:sigma-70 family RNA polymerase sigma factor [Alicyclobacillus macrosporangiidus]|uniref:RNA polymerase sigma factor n=1 Tax=Alicyclobacillus macrosporangiidus TaxID=392015 RepID=UPI0009423203
MHAYWQRAWAYVYSLTNDPFLTDDLTQDVFVRAYTSLDQFRNESSYKTWLFSIARNRCKDFQKSAFFRRVVPIDFHRTQSLDAEHTSAEDEAVRAIERNELWKAILTLKKPYREVVILHLREDMTFAEIAAVLSIPEVTARARYRRALQQLRAIYNTEVNRNDI